MMVRKTDESAVLSCSVPGMYGGVHADHPVREALYRMRRRRLETLFVVNGDELVGMVNVNVILHRAKAQADDFAAVPVFRIMNHDVLVCTRHTPVGEAVSKLDANGMTRIAVLDDDDHLLGTASLPDLSRSHPNAPLQLSRRINVGSELWDMHRWQDVSGGRARCAWPGELGSYCTNLHVPVDRQI